MSGGKKCLFFGNFGVLCFLETPVLRFALLSYSRPFDFARVNRAEFSPKILHTVPVTTCNH